MPDWRIKIHQEDKKHPGSKNRGNKPIRLENQILETNMPELGTGVRLSVQSPFSGGPSLFYLNLQKFHWASFIIGKMSVPLGWHGIAQPHIRFK